LPLSDNALQRVIVLSPSKRGLLLFRTVIDDDRHLSTLDALQRQGRCESVRVDPEAQPAGHVSP
jgi:hypothetical protein